MREAAEGQGGGMSVDLADLRVGVLALVADPGWLDWPKDELRPVLLKAFPALYVYAGALCPPPG